MITLKKTHLKVRTDNKRGELYYWQSPLSNFYKKLSLTKNYQNKLMDCIILKHQNAISLLTMIDFFCIIKIV